jgi:hypothetical protein
MDDVRFDRLTKSLWMAGSRRGAVRLLLSAPIFGVLASILASVESEAEHPTNRVLRRKA